MDFISQHPWFFFYSAIITAAAICFAISTFLTEKENKKLKKKITIKNRCRQKNLTELLKYVTSDQSIQSIIMDFSIILNTINSGYKDNNELRKIIHERSIARKESESERESTMDRIEPLFNLSFEESTELFNIIKKLQQ